MRRSRGSALLLLTVVLASRCVAVETITVTPTEDEQIVLHNPEMGWVLYENYPVDPAPGGSSTMLTLPDETFPGVDEVAVMFSWFDVEKSEGKYDFAAVDKAYDYWAKRGKRIQLRMSTETLLWWDNASPPRGKGPPDYVVERLRNERKQRREGGGFPAYVVLDARDTFYLDRLGKFLEAVAKHYGKERPVTLIDLRGFGLWGEWHSGFKYASLEDRRAALIGIIDAYARAFPNNWLSLSYSYDPDGPAELYAGPYKSFDEAFTKTYDQYLRYSAFDYALTKPNVTFRRDGCGGAVHSNERKLCEQAFAAATRGPFMSEFMDGYAQSKEGEAGWVKWKVDDALSLHPNYVNLLGYQGTDALGFLREQKDLIEHGLRTMGYRLVPTNVTYPEEITSDEAFEISGEWINRAVGRAMKDFRLMLVLAGSDGKPIASCTTEPLETSKWLKGNTYKMTCGARFRGVGPGTYDLRIGLIDPVTSKPVGLPLRDPAGDGSYRVGRIRVTSNR
jgi:uncharacterized protein DUF4832/glycosyl hydrolase family 42 (putative beta-galactosidase)